MKTTLALGLCGLQTLQERRVKRCLTFALNCTKHEKNKRMFPVNEAYNNPVRNSEPYLVNFAGTETYKKCAIPYCQRLLNKHVMKKIV